MLVSRAAWLRLCCQHAALLAAPGRKFGDQQASIMILGSSRSLGWWQQQLACCKPRCSRVEAAFQPYPSHDSAFFNCRSLITKLDLDHVFRVLFVHYLKFEWRASQISNSDCLAIMGSAPSTVSSVRSSEVPFHFLSLADVILCARLQCSQERPNMWSGEYGWIIHPLVSPPPL